MKSKSQTFILTLLLLLFMLSVAQLVGGVIPRGGEPIPCRIACPTPAGGPSCSFWCYDGMMMQCWRYWGYATWEDCYWDV